uniref:Uncharacterized protein n=1 Tax=Avena sativa TaxID=4498 RepID=A0ACD5XHA7_AVESA
MAGARAEAVWKVLFRERMRDVHAPLSMIVWNIGNARGALSEPVRAPATDAMRARMQRAERALEDACRDLGAAAYLLGSAEELALRGGAYAPWYPLPSVRRLRDTAAAQRSASRKLREARLFAVEAYHCVEQCCVCLMGVRLLLDHPLLPGVDGFLDEERGNALHLLEDHLMGAVDGCVSLVRSARKDVPGGWPTG